MEPQGEPVAVCEGEIVGDRYRVRGLLGRGGMGYVLEAEHLQLGHRVALKFLASGFCKNPRAVERFMREGRSAVRIESEHVARMLDVGQLDSGEPYLVMELLDGLDLGQLLAGQGPLSCADAVDYVLQACDALGDAHALGIVHRDLKPANLFLTHRRDGSSLVKVLDFGISKATEGQLGAPSMTATNVVMGSPQYMSPEQIRSSKHVDSRTDIWALGTVLYELVAGRPPYDAETLPAVCAAIASDPVPPLGARRANVPPELEAAVMRCLEKDPEKRFQTLAELGAALVPFGPIWAPMLAERLLRLLGTGAPSVPTPRVHTWPSDPPPGNGLPAPMPAVTGPSVPQAGVAVETKPPSTSSLPPEREQAPAAGPQARCEHPPSADAGMAAPAGARSDGGAGLEGSGTQTGASWGSTKLEALGVPAPRRGLWLGLAAGALLLMLSAATLLVRANLSASGRPAEGAAPARTETEQPTAAGVGTVEPERSSGSLPSDSSDAPLPDAGSEPDGPGTGPSARAPAPAVAHARAGTKASGSSAREPAAASTGAKAADEGPPAASSKGQTVPNFGGRKF
jgi:serine/threonine protein kinase